MKIHKTIRVGIIVIGIIVCFFACRKTDPDKVLEKPDSVSNAFRSSGCSMDGISLECYNVPHFASAEIFESMLNCLEADYDAYNDSIQNHFSTLSDDAFNDTLDALGIDDELPLESFENTVGYVSLRHVLRISEDAWLNNSTLVAANDPINNSPIGDDPVMSTLFNEFGEVMIGDTIYKYMADGSLLSIINGSCQTLDSLRNDLIPDAGSSNIRIMTFNSDTLDCQTQKHTHGVVGYTAGKEYKWRLSIYTGFFGTFAKASTRSFKQKSNGHWKRFKTHIAAQVYGTIWNSICTESDSTSKSKSKNKRSKIVARKYWSVSVYKTESGRLHSAHQCGSSSAYSQFDLTW